MERSITSQACVEECDDAEAFLRFLKNVLNEYPIGRSVMVLDNARIYRTKLLQLFLKDNQERIELVFLPPYSPQLNLMEVAVGICLQQYILQFSL